MYIRMFVLMLISFYTTRVVLKTLGETDFGIYNVVGSIVVLFTFINGAMTTATQRCLSYELGKENGNLKQIFSACLNLHGVIAVAIFIFAETIGLWLVNNKMNFPIDRLSSVFWVYQYAILSSVVSILRVPFNALVVAHEDLDFFAYMGIVEGVLKLGIVFLLVFSSFDKLIFYSFLIFLVSILITLVFVLFSKVKYFNTNRKLVSRPSTYIYRQILSFSSWTLFGAIANIGRNQGMGIILNIFYGVTVNAAIGIANQVNASVNQLVTGFQQAFNPQLTKVEATKNRELQTELIVKTAKYSFYIILFLSVPLLYNLEFVLNLWLTEIPLYTKEICFWIIIASLIDSISGPLWVTIFATGNIKRYQIVVSIALLMILPMTYVCSLLNINPYYSYLCCALLNIVTLSIRLYFLKRLVDFQLLYFLKQVLKPIICVSILVFIVFTIDFGKELFTYKEILISTILLLLYEIIIIYCIGLTKTERGYIYQMIQRRLK